jgi:uncharacterized repeat protein (TIGR03843 family)
MASIQTSKLQNAWAASDERVIEALRDSEVTDLRLVADSSNYVFVADLQHPDLGAGLGVYKPERGEQPLHDFPYGTLYQREVAAYEYSRLLGWDAVPPTVERDGPHGIGSMQLFVPHNPSDHYFELRERDAYDDQFAQIAAFDLVANNADRKGGHLLLGADERIWCIDNGLCFNTVHKVRTVIWDYSGIELPEDWQADLRRVRDCLVDGGEGAEVVSSLLAEDEVAALIRRSDELLGYPVLPEMFPYRCVPWPLI